MKLFADQDVYACTVKLLRDLGHDVGYGLFWQRRVLLRVPLENVSRCPLDGEEMKPVFRLTNFDRANNVRMLHPGAIFGLAKKPRYRSLILAEFFT